MQICIKLLQETAEKEAFKIWAYCFMSDHLHVLVEGMSDKSDFGKFMSLYKQKTGYAISKFKKTKLWQENYYEHVLRHEEDTLSVVKYILNNPVRKNIVKKFEEYPYSGSFELDIRQMV